MANTALGSLLHYLRRLHDRSAAEATDGELLRRHLDGDKAAFAALLRRHTPMVWSVCRRLLDNEQDAEDAFQAAFLVLLRKAESLRVPQSVAAFLHGVASRIARKALVTSQRRRRHEAQAEMPRSSDPFVVVEQQELRALLDEELDRLPEKYRAPLVLCYLEGLSYTEAARQLGWRDGTVCSRLARARQLLRQRLSRRGLTLSGTALAALSESTSAPAASVAAVSRMAALFALGQTAVEAVSPPVAALAQGILQAMTVAKLKTLAALVPVLCLFAAGAGVTASHFLAMKPPEVENGVHTPPDKPAPSKSERADLFGDPLPPGALLRLGTVRFRNRDGIGQIVYSPDGKLLAAGGFRGHIFLYDAATGRKLRQLQALAFLFPALAFAPDGKTLACADSQTVQIWDVAAGKELRRMGIKSKKHFDYDFLVVVPLVFSHDGQALAWVAGDHSIHVWDAKTGKELVELSGHQKTIRCLAFSSDDKTLFSASYDRMKRDGTVRVWQAATGKETRKFSLPRRQARDWLVPLCFSPDGETFVFSVHEDLPPKKGGKVLENGYRLAFLDLETEKRSSNVVAQPGQVKTATFSPDGKSIAAIREVPRTADKPRLEHHNRLQMWDVATGKQLVDFPAYANDSPDHCHLAFSPDGNKLAAAANASALHVWDVARGREDPEMTQTHHARTCCVAFSPDGRTVATGSADHTIALWDAVTGEQRRCLRGHEGEVASAAFSPDGKLLASADHTVRLWDLSSGKELRRFSVPGESLGEGMTRSVHTWIAFTANGKILAAGGTDRKVRLWETATGKELLNREVRGLPARSKQGTNDRKDDVHGVAFSADGRVLAFTIGPIDYVVDVAAGQRLFRFEKDRNVIPRGGLSADGRTMACLGLDNFLRLGEVASGKDVQKIELPENSGAVKVAFSPDDRTIAATDWSQGWIVLFDVRTGKQLLRLQGAASVVQQLAFSPDGNKLASAQTDGTAVVWDVSAARLKLPTRSLNSGDLERLWADMRDADAPKAHTALWTLVAAPDKAVPFLQAHLHLVPRVTAERLHRLIVDLDSDDFARRQEAARKLVKLGSEAEPALRKALEGKPSLEVRRRVEALLNDLACQTEMTPDALRQVRAIEVLEQIGSPQARHILALLAQGAPAAPATRDAAAALTRLDRLTHKTPQ